MGTEVNRNRRPMQERFWEKVAVVDGHWLWMANKNNAGYGLIWCPDAQKKIYAHRWAYEQENGPIPQGYDIDHLCRVPACVNPAHLEAVTHRENILRSVAPPALNARKTHCAEGHPYDGENTYIKPSGYRECRTCGKRRAAEMERRRGRILKSAATALGMSVPTYIDLHGKSMRKAMQIAGHQQQEEREAVV